MYDLKEALESKFNEIVQTYEVSTLDRNVSYPYATFDTPSTSGFAEYRDDVTILINIYDDLCNSIGEIEALTTKFRQLNKYCLNTTDGRFDLLFVGRNDYTELENDVRRKEVTFLAKWYDANFFPEE